TAYEIRDAPGNRITAEYHVIRRRTEVQASSTWTPPGGTLGRILEETRRRLPSLDGVPGYRQGAAPPAFGEALRRETVAVIAELKRRSPSKGILDDNLDPARTADYERGGAAAISVLTEPAFFGGTTEDLVAARSVVSLPLLKK